MTADRTEEKSKNNSAQVTGESASPSIVIWRLGLNTCWLPLPLKEAFTRSQMEVLDLTEG